MLKILPYLFLIALIACSDSDDADPAASTELKRRLILEKEYSQYGSFVSDSILEHYEDKKITRSEHFRRYRTQEEIMPYRAFYIQYEYDPMGMMTQYKLYNDSGFTDQFATKTYHYNTDNSIQKITAEKIKPSNISDQLYSYSTSYEYIADTVRVIRDNHLDDERDWTSTYVISADFDSILSVNSNNLYLYDAQKDLVTRKYLGDPADVMSWQQDISYGDEREPVIDNFFGSRKNLFLIPGPIKYYSLERTSKYRTYEFIHTHRTNETISFEYTFNAENYLPQEVRRGGTFYGGDVIRYFYD